MSITSITQSKSGGLSGGATTLTAVSSLVGTIYFYWYRDGMYAGMSSGTGTIPAVLSVTWNGSLAVVSFDQDVSGYDLSATTLAIGGDVTHEIFSSQAGAAAQYSTLAFGAGAPYVLDLSAMGWGISSGTAAATPVPPRTPQNVGSFTFALSPSDQARIAVLDSLDPPEVFDPVDHGPVAYPPRRMIVWTRSIDAGVARYLIEQQAAGGSWVTVGSVNDSPRIWQFAVTSPRLSDLTLYAWRVTPIDAVGNAGTPLALAQELIVRTPDAPGFTLSFDPGTRHVTLAGA